jgi:hypothetical protein
MTLEVDEGIPDRTLPAARHNHCFIQCAKAAIQSAMDTKGIRAESQVAARACGVRIPDHLPLPDPISSLRSKKEVEDRILALHAVVAASFGFDKTKALSWIRQEFLQDALSPFEKDFLEQGKGSPAYFRSQVEAMWVLAWGLSIVANLDFRKACDSGFVRIMPDLKASESGKPWRGKAVLRSADELLAQCDLAYCLHWAIRQASLDRKPPSDGLRDGVVVPRRRSLEWMLSNESWDDISLDT